MLNFNQFDVQKKATNIQLSDGSSVEGLVYSKGYIDFKGNITGSLYCNGFILRTPSAVYENHLLNASINSTELPEFYVGNFPSEDVKRRAVVKRLE